MKKIISTAAAVLAFSMAFADVSVEFTQAGYVTSDRGGESVKLDVNGYDSDKKITGCVVTEISNDVAGVVFDLDPWMNDKSRQKVDGKMLDQYYGWVNFLGGKATLQSGVWTSRSVNRMKQDAGSWENDEYEANKPGVITGTVAKDVTNLTDGNLATQLSYNFDMGYAKFAIVDSDYYDGVSSLKSGFAAEAGFNVSQDLNFKVYLKNLKDQQIAFAVFGESNGSFKEGLDLVAGLTFGNVKATSGFEFGVDVRARYELNEKLAFTTMNNLSSKGSVYTLWDMISVAYKVSDKTKLTVTGEWNYANLAVEQSGNLSIIPGITYTPCDGADVTTGIIIETTGWKKPSGSSVSIPVVLHVAL